MDKRDVLESEVRVTVLGDSGQYVFDWVNYDKKSVKFSSNQSDYDEYNEEVINVLNQNGIYIADNAEDINKDEGEDINTNPTSSVEPITGTPDAGDNEADDINPASPTDIESEKKDTIIEDVNDENDTEQDTNFQPISNESVENENKNKNDEPDENENKITKSFIVRINDPKERRDIINKIKDNYPEASDQMELTGPYRITYEIKKDGIELSDVDDIGINSSVN